MSRVDVGADPAVLRFSPEHLLLIQQLTFKSLLATYNNGSKLSRL